LDRRARVELFAEIRREYQSGVGTIKGVSRKLGVHRRVVRQALADAMPPVRLYRTRKKLALAPVQDFIDRILEADRTAPRKQRHTARRIHDRLRRERPASPVAASTVREYVRGWKRAQGLIGRTVCVPQTYTWGQEAQVDWYEAVAILGDEAVTLQVFCLRSMASGAAFHRAYPRATQQAFLEAHEDAFQARQYSRARTRWNEPAWWREVRSSSATICQTPCTTSTGSASPVGSPSASAGMSRPCWRIWVATGGVQRPCSDCRPPH